MKSIAEAFEKIVGSNIPNLNHDDLTYCAGALDLAGRELENLSEVLQNVGCLINSDGDGTGCFQEKVSVSTLCFNISSQLETIRALVNLGDAATYRLINGGVK